MSGPHGALGDRVLDRIRTALVAAAMTRWEVRDDQGTERGVAEAAAWARERQCEVWVGGIGDREARAMVREARDQGVRLVGLWSRPIDQDDDRVIGVTPDRRAPMAILARYLEATGSRDVFLLAGPTAADRERAEVLQRSWSGSGKVVQVTALADPRASAAALVSAMTAERGDPGCQPQAVLLLGDPDLAVRWKGFLEAEGVLQSRGRCPAPLLAGPPSWAAPEALRRYGLALEGAVTVAWRDEEGSPEADPLALGARLAVAAVLHHVRGPRGSGWEGLEAALGEVTARYQAGRWQGVDPAPLRLEGGRALWVETRPDPDARDR